MMHYGSAGNINDRWFSHEPPHHHQAIRDRTASPAYSSLDRHRDDYNRYETARHSHTKNIQRTRHDEESDRSRFSGYGDRPGSGVEFAPSKWHGGEIITDRRQLPKSLKPRRIYYSPIGDGVVAADGLEMKRQPKDMSPRISVTQTRVVERGADPGRDGYNLYEKHLTHSGAANEYDSEYGGAGGGGTSGRNSRSTGAFSPSGDSYVGMGGGAGTLQYSPGSVGAASGGAGALAGAAPGHGSESGLGSGQLPGPPRGEYHRSGAVTPKHVQHAPPSNYHHAQRERDYGNEPLGDIYPLSGSASCAPRYMPAGGGITGSGVGRFYSSNTPTPTNSPLAAVYGSSAPASNYTTLASRAAAGTADHPSATFHSAHHSESCYTSDYKATRSRSHDPATDGFDGLSAAGGYAGSGGGGAGGPHYYGGAGMDGRSSAASGYSYSLRTDSPRRYDTLSTDYLITNPRELIHQYATTTPVAVLDVNNANDSLSRGDARAAAYTNSMAATTTEERYAPYPPYRDLTISQREANRHMEPLNPKGSNYEQKIYELRNRTTTKGGTNMGDEIDYLTERMMYGLQTGHPTPPQL
ncbi:unnamed protein product [Anisakis simplex]|uniref:Rhomboid domain-containing protein n=1 Tax=Anisakis simplex TaxID=6269 RepID=A0A0M3K745_ANISI|nr:unnamed protein product [Anisakis simplex]